MSKSAKPNPAPGRDPSRRRALQGMLSAASGLLLSGCSTREAVTQVRRPNILFAISDDQSWSHTGAYGDPVVQTPGFDRVAREGVRFDHAYTAAPSCTPSRSSILTGQAMWRLGEGGNLYSTLPKGLDVFPLLLEQAGYFIGYTGKGWGPGDYRFSGRARNPLGERYSERKLEAPQGISSNDYAANFEDFLAAQPDDQPFFFWYGATEPHVPYKTGCGLEWGKKLEDVRVPAFLPDCDVVRSDILDYSVEIEWFDQHLARMLNTLEQAGELDNTLVVVTSDNGMPLPRAKASLYDWGTRMPLAIRWPERVPEGRVVDDFVSLTDLAPTFLQAAEAEAPEAMTGQSLMNVLLSEEQGRIDPSRDRVFTGLERHAMCRPNGAGYPCRAMRTHEYLYIRNYEPDRWPGGDPDFVSSHMGVYGEYDNCPTKTFMLEEHDNPRFRRKFQLAFSKRPAEEIYHVRSDPGQTNNLAGDPNYTQVQREMAQRLEQYLTQTEDPRMKGLAPWDTYPYFYGKYDPRKEPES